MKPGNFDEEGRFVMENYNASRPFASFLPGIGGKKSIPMWVFYVNRAQCVTSFGISDKDHAIMEFNSAVKAYQSVRTLGFRTFIKLPSEGVFYEPFTLQESEKVIQRMYIGRNELEIEEINEELGLKINVLYYTIPNERISALVRRTTIKNISGLTRELEMLDGMPIVVPYGTNDFVLKNILTTIKAWMEVYNLENNMPFFKLKSSTEDVPKVEELTEGTFYITFVKKGGKSRLVRPIVDPEIVFGPDTSYLKPEEFIKKPLSDLTEAEQATFNKLPSAFTPLKIDLSPGEEATVYSVIGFVPHISLLDEYSRKFADEEYLIRKYKEAQEVIEEIVKDIHTETSSRLFDEYSKQCYLDNVLRGGYPLIMESSKPLVYYIYLRRHGDQERDYNYFVLTPEYYSSGNGSYRDVNQNRREDVFFHPGVKEYDVKFFVNLIQADGYNPLLINGVRYRLKDSPEFLDRLVDKSEELREFLKEPFTPGKLIMFMEEKGINLKVSEEKFFEELLGHCEEEVIAEHGEGYWCDHWTYNLDLIESYLGVYPENKRKLFFEDYDYTYYDNHMVVLPRGKRYVVEKGKVRQYNSLAPDEEKRALIESRNEPKHLMRTKKGRGEIYRANLATKLLNLALIKFATLDPEGIGIEMEAGKPGWYDALNGLPGLFGSSVGESVELVRLLDLLMGVFQEFPEETLRVPEEVWWLLKEELRLLREYRERGDAEKDHWLWDALSTLREEYRERTRLGFEGSEVEVRAGDLLDGLRTLREKLMGKLEEVIEENNGLMPMYFYYEPIKWEIGENGEVRILGFRRKGMPLFLEGIVKQFRLFREDRGYLKELYKKVKESDLYDRKLKMYKLNSSLKDQPIEIGRAKAFPPGWLENESIWLHMEYKYMLELIKSGLFEEFYEDFRNVIVAFLDPQIYGRSPLENSSFIVSSAYPDEKLHGGGFVARLTGANAEFLSMWKIMFIGKGPFRLENGEIALVFSPALPGWLFDEEGRVTFNLFGRVRVVYHNPSRRNTWEMPLEESTVVIDTGKEKITVEGNKIKGKYAEMVRSGDVRKIDVYFPGEEVKK